MFGELKNCLFFSRNFVTSFQLDWWRTNFQLLCVSTTMEICTSMGKSCLLYLLHNKQYMPLQQFPYQYVNHWCIFNIGSKTNMAGRCFTFDRHVLVANDYLTMYNPCFIGFVCKWQHTHAQSINACPVSNFVRTLALSNPKYPLLSSDFQFKQPPYPRNSKKPYIV